MEYMEQHQWPMNRHFNILGHVSQFQKWWIKQWHSVRNNGPTLYLVYYYLIWFQSYYMKSATTRTSIENNTHLKKTQLTTLTQQTTWPLNKGKCAAGSKSSSFTKLKQQNQKSAHIRAKQNIFKSHKTFIKLSHQY